MRNSCCGQSSTWVARVRYFAKSAIGNQVTSTRDSAVATQRVGATGEDCGSTTVVCGRFACKSHPGSTATSIRVVCIKQGKMGGSLDGPGDRRRDQLPCRGNYWLLRHPSSALTVPAPPAICCSQPLPLSKLCA